MANVTVPDIRKIPVDQIDPNAWNPNAMDDESFQRLVSEIENVGFIEPVQVVPIEGGRYRLIGGEHRWRAAKQLGMEKVPANLLTDEKWKDEDLQKFVTVRLNVLRGKVNAERFIALYNEMAAKYGAEKLQDLMGYVDPDAWGKLVGSLKSTLKSSGLSDEMANQFEDKAKKVSSVDDLEGILSTLFQQYGDTLGQNFMVFSHGGKDHMYVTADEETFAKAKQIAEFAKTRRVDVNKVFHRLFRDWEKAVEDIPTPEEDWAAGG